MKFKYFAILSKTKYRIECLSDLYVYAFGRSQGLDTSFGEKIIFSPMNDKPNFVYYTNPECTLYSGYCIKKINGLSIEELMEQLNSDRMDKFVSMSSRDFRNGWKAYNKKIIENFEVLV